MTAHIQQDSKHTFHETSRLNKSYPNLEIRLACVEDGLDNSGFRKVSAMKKLFTKRYHLPEQKTDI